MAKPGARKVEVEDDAPPIEVEKQRITVKISTVWATAVALVLAVTGAVSFYFHEEERIHDLEKRLDRFISWQKDHNTFPGLPTTPAADAVLTDDQGRVIVDDKTGNPIAVTPPAPK